MSQHELSHDQTIVREFYGEPEWSDAHFFSIRGFIEGFTEEPGQSEEMEFEDRVLADDYEAAGPPYSEEGADSEEALLVKDIITHGLVWGRGFTDKGEEKLPDVDAIIERWKERDNLRRQRIAERWRQEMEDEIRESAKPAA